MTFPFRTDRRRRSLWWKFGLIHPILPSLLLQHFGSSLPPNRSSSYLPGQTCINLYASARIHLDHIGSSDKSRHTITLLLPNPLGRPLCAILALCLPPSNCTSSCRPASLTSPQVTELLKHELYVPSWPQTFQVRPRCCVCLFLRDFRNLIIPVRYTYLPRTGEGISQASCRQNSPARAHP